jgi:DNA polymerase-3 subunit epsilon
MRQIILDTETTGLQPEQGHRIIEIGCVELVNRKFTGKKFHQYINPEREVEEGALAVHGITNQFLLDKPLFSAIAPAFMDFISDAELIIHNAPFDTGFIDHELMRVQQNWKPLKHYCRIVDSLVLARQMHPGQRNSLDALCKRYSIDNSHREYHGALLDARLLAEVYLIMTGGQGSLFEETELTEKKAQENHDNTEIQLVPRKLAVQLASVEEQLEHQKWLDLLRQKGKCVWQE